MKKQAGFGFFMVMIFASIVAGVIYIQMIRINADAEREKAARLAVQVTPALFAMVKFSMTKMGETINSSDYYSTYYDLSSDYETTLKNAGYDTTGSGIDVVSSA